jgi:hypothetical protein
VSDWVAGILVGRLLENAGSMKIKAGIWLLPLLERSIISEDNPASTAATLRAAADVLRKAGGRRRFWADGQAFGYFIFYRSVTYTGRVLVVDMCTLDGRASTCRVSAASQYLPVRNRNERKPTGLSLPPSP